MKDSGFSLGNLGSTKNYHLLPFRQKGQEKAKFTVHHFGCETPAHFTSFGTVLILVSLRVFLVEATVCMLSCNRPEERLRIHTGSSCDPVFGTHLSGLLASVQKCPAYAYSVALTSGLLLALA